jgi:excisionase family DNA binding protein
MDKDYLTIFEVAGITKYTVGTLRKLVLKKQIPFHKIRRSLRFRRGELALWIQSGGKEVVYLPDDDGSKPETHEGNTKPGTEQSGTVLDGAEARA